MPQSVEKSIEFSSRLSGSEKAAALIMLMGKDIAINMSEHFSSEELQGIYEAAIRLPELGYSEINSLTSEFKSDFFNSTLFPSEDSVNELFSELDNDIGRGKTSTTTTTNSSSQSDDDDDQDLETIRGFFETEKPRISAYLLGKLDAQIASKVLDELDGELRNSILQSFLSRREISPEVESMFAKRLSGVLKNSVETVEERKEIEIAASFINQLSENTANDALKFIAETDSGVATSIKKRLFRFENVELLTKPERVLLLDSLQADEIAAALSGVEGSLKECILDTLSPRNKRVVDAELTRGGASEEARDSAKKKIVYLAVELARDGKLVLPEQT